MVLRFGRRQKQSTDQPQTELSQVDVAERPASRQPSGSESPAAPENDARLWTQIDPVLQSLIRGQFAEAWQQTEDLPEPQKTSLQQLIESWNSKFIDILIQASAAVEHGMKPLVSARQLAQDTRLQNEDVTQMAAASEQLAASVDEIAGNARNAAQEAETVSQQVEEGLNNIETALDGMTYVGEAVEQLHGRVDEMAATVEPIQQVLRLIEEVASQTNLLALNAAIEAARAGEHGRGFAVVASEVRRLAERTQSAVQDVQEKIHALMDGTQVILEVMDEVGQRVSEGSKLALSGRDHLHQTRDRIRQGTLPLHQIAATTEEQAEAVSLIAGSSQNISKAADSIENAAAELSFMVDDLQHSLSQLRESTLSVNARLGDRELLQLSRSDHLLWVQRLNRMLLGREDIDPDEVVDHTRCRLGRWYYSVGQSRYAHLEPYRQLEEPHQKLHKTAAKAASSWRANRRDEARRYVEELIPLSETIVNLLHTLEQNL